MHSTRFPFESFDNEAPQEESIAPDEGGNAEHGDGDADPATIANENAQDGTDAATEPVEETPDPVKLQAFAEGKAEGIAEGKAAALAEVNAAQEQLAAKTAAALEALNIQLATLFANTETYSPTYFTPFIHQLAWAIARKITGNNLKEHASKEIEDHINHSLEVLFDQPILTIYLHPELETSMNAKIQELAAKHNFRGKILVKPDQTLTETECKLDWQEGFLSLSKEELQNNIQKVLGELPPTATDTPPTDTATDTPAAS